MKRKVLLLTLPVCVLLIAALCACSSPDKPGTTGAPEKTAAPATDGAAVTPAPGDDTTAAPTDAPTAVPPAATPTADTRPLPEPGTMVYYEDFSGYGDVTGTNETIRKLGWTILTVAEDGATSDWTAELSIKDGKLYIKNYWENEETVGQDGYAMLFNEKYMERALKTGSYTLQYDVTYTGAGNYKRYINIVTEYSSASFNSFHFRIAGYGNNQCFYGNTWFSYDANDGTNLYAGRKKTNDVGQTIANKLLGIEGTVDTPEAIDNFKNVPVTIRVVRVNGLSTLYMKTAEMPELIKISVPSTESQAYNLASLITGTGVCLKTGGPINGIVDNIAIWTGTGEMPADHTVTYEP